MTHREISDKYQDPETPLNIPKVAKKAAINYLIPTVLAVAGIVLFMAVRAWADDRYTKKEDAAIVQASENKSLQDEQQKREALEGSVQEMNRKLDILIYIAQHGGQLDTRDFKGKTP